jgi:sulfatase modifying factor 1
VTKARVSCYASPFPMTPRTLAAVPLAVVGLGLGLSSALDASARDGEPAAAATRAMFVTPKPSTRRSHGRDGATPRKGTKRFCAWGDCAVSEGKLPDPRAGAVCPPGTANVDDRFCIDRWEASLVEVLPEGRETPWPPFNAIEDGRSLRAVSVPDVYPQAYISGAQAAKACSAAGKRLCSPVEWRKACMGPSAQAFGYGSERITGRCNDEGQGRSPMLRLYPQVATSWSLVGMTEMNDPRLNQLTDTLARTGSHEGCTNGYGVFDMVGNVHEWTNDPHGTFQGGYYLDTHLNGDGCAYRTVAHEVTYHDYSTGFRCCADASEPNSDRQ